jgi:hypothetical protein
MDTYAQTQQLSADRLYGKDDFRSVYYGKNNVVYKLSDKGIMQYYAPQLGEVTSVDIINPLKIILFYEQTQQVVVLDNRLNEIQRLPLAELIPGSYVTYVGLAGERRLWIYNSNTLTLDLYDYINNRRILRTPPISGNVTTAASDFNFCYLLTDNELLMFNIYGSLMDKKKISGEKIIIDHDLIGVFHKDSFTFFKRTKVNRLDRLQLNYDEELKAKIGVGAFTDFFLRQNILYLYHEKQLVPYELSQSE